MVAGKIKDRFNSGQLLFERVLQAETSVSLVLLTRARRIYTFPFVFIPVEYK